MDDDDKPCNWTFFYLETVISYVPALVFFVTGTINFYKIRSLGFNRVVRFSVFFKIKLACCLLLGLITILNLIISLSNHSWVDKDDIFKKCLKENA